MMVCSIPKVRRISATRPAAGYVNVRLSRQSAQYMFFLLLLVLGPTDRLVTLYLEQAHCPNISHFVIMPLLAASIFAGSLCLKALELERANKQIELKLPPTLAHLLTRIMLVSNAEEELK